MTEITVEPTLKNVAQGVAPGKVILIGEHSVVYGYPAIAMPLTHLQLRADVRVHSSMVSTLRSSIYTGPLNTTPPQVLNISTAASESLKAIGMSHRAVDLRIESEIPVTRGLGSSAATAVAIVRGIHQLFGAPLSRETLYNIVQKSETIAHGVASGLDAYTTTSDHIVLFQQTQVRPLDHSIDAFLVIADTGVMGSTRECVMAVRDFLHKNPRRAGAYIDQLSVLTMQVADAMTQGDLEFVGHALRDAHTVLQKLDVSHPSLDVLVDASMDAGALGAKLTGSGRGGCAFALCENEKSARRVMDAMEDAGAIATWIQPLVGALQ